MAPRHTESQHLLHHRPLRASASGPWQRQAELGGAGDRPWLTAINNNSKPICLGLTRKCKLETIGCGLWSPDTLCRAVGSGEEAEIPSNSNYTEHGTVWGWELLPSAMGSPTSHPVCCPRLLLSTEICWERARMGGSASMGSAAPGAQLGARMPSEGLTAPQHSWGCIVSCVPSRIHSAPSTRDVGGDEGLSPVAKVGWPCTGAPSPGSTPPWGTGRSEQSSLLQGRLPQQQLAMSCELPAKRMLRAAGPSAPPRRKTMSQQLRAFGGWGKGKRGGDSSHHPQSHPAVPRVGTQCIPLLSPSFSS